jgi:ubiquinone/menaquinone biosynthesis C-methylase UbiE
VAPHKSRSAGPCASSIGLWYSSSSYGESSQTLAQTNAQIYVEHRPRYPQALIEDLRLRTSGDHGELLVDWGCGTGELTLPLSKYFDRVRAVDANAERISIAEETARRKAIDHVEWQVGKAEELEITPESCDLITSASAFHWMDREMLSVRAFEGLKPGGAFAITGGAGDDIWRGRKEWHRIAIECLNQYLDRPSEEEKQVVKVEATQAQEPGGRSAASQDPPPAKKWHTDFLEAAGFNVESLQHPTEFTWPVDDVAGYMYSITGGLQRDLGDQRDAFERDFSQALTRLDPSGVMRDTINFFLLIATKP